MLGTVFSKLFEVHSDKVETCSREVGSEDFEFVLDSSRMVFGAFTKRMLIEALPVRNRFKHFDFGVTLGPMTNPVDDV
jgi:hypothetical protein